MAASRALEPEIPPIEEIGIFTHSELVALTRDTLNVLLKEDPLLCDLPSNITLEEVESQNAVQQGSALTVLVERGDKRPLRVVVDRQNATVIRLKHALQRQMATHLERETGHKRSISWKHVWKTSCLVHNGTKLLDDNATLISLGIGNKSKLTFEKRLNPKGKLHGKQVYQH